MHKDYRSYDIVNSLSQELLDTVERDSTIPVMDMPYEKEESLAGLPIYTPKDIVFYNTRAFSEMGDRWMKTGSYTDLHPIYNKKEYDAFWDEEERRRKEGLTLPCALVKKDDGRYVLQDLHITGEHYGYLNYAPIKRVKQETLRRIEELVKRGEDVTNLQDEKEVALPQFFDSDYYYFKAIELARSVGRHLVVGKARRKGYSYKNGWVSANRADLYRNTVTGIAAYNSDSLYPEGTMTMADNYLQHIGATTDWAKRRLIDKTDTIKFGYKKNDGLGIEYGFKSSILARSFATNNPGAIRGKDCTVILLEESGKNPLLSAVLASTLPTLKAGAVVTGLMIVFGTGGGEDKQWEGFEDLFYNTYKHKFITFSNIWDDDLEGTGCGFFHSALMNKPGLIDEHGNSNIKEAHQFEEEERALLGKGSSKATKHAMEEPYKPSEAFSRVADGIMPSEYLDAQYRRVKSSPFIKGLARDGIFVNNSKGISFIDKRLAPPSMKDKIHDFVTDYPLKKETDVHGCWRLWEQPYRNKTGKIPDGLYRVWNDPFGIDKTKKHFSIKDSLGTVYIYEVANNFTPTKGDRIIGAFHGRREQGSDFNIQMFLAAQYYNAKILYENDRGSVYVDAKTHKVLDLLEDEPTFEYQKSLTKGGLGRKKGISIAGNSQRKKNGAIFLKDWLLTKRGIDENGNSLLNLHYYYDEGGLKELIKYDGIKNADRASCLIVGMYDVKEMQYKQEAPDTTPPVVDDYLKELGSTNDLYNREQVIDNYFEEL